MGFAGKGMISQKVTPQPKVFQRTWRNPQGHQEYTFRHTIIQKVQGTEKPKQRREFQPSYHHHPYHPSSYTMNKRV